MGVRMKKDERGSKNSKNFNANCMSCDGKTERSVGTAVPQSRQVENDISGRAKPRIVAAKIEDQHKNHAGNGVVKVKKRKV